MDTLKDLAMQTALTPKESPLALKKKGRKISIGLPKELSADENRIVLTPDAVGVLVRNGIDVTVEAGAGSGANFSDTAYAEAGADIVSSRKEVFDNDIILKIEPLREEEFEYIRTSSTLISTINLPKLTAGYFKKLNEKQVTAIGFELIEDKAGEFPVIRTISEIAGSSAILIGSEYLSSANGGRGVILGGVTGVPPRNVVVVGAGTVGEFAVRSALGLGAGIKVFDRQIYRLRRLQYAVGARVYTSVIDSVNLPNALMEADLVVGALRSEFGFAPMVITEEMVSRMKPNSVIVDVAIDTGGCCETSEVTSHRKPVFKKYGVIHYCVPNIASRFAHTASEALSNIFAPVLMKAANLGGIDEMILHNKWFMRGVITHKGSVTHLNLARRFNLRYKDLGLIISAGF
ncbi:alanine dehydrogenase [Leadbetterella sp. DM7]|uniref:alanine dehydrogenase n=1 Tax=Leadbetterella sp. DM7 TaxID=3235085 RepID=UPI00349EF0F5